MATNTENPKLAIKSGRATLKLLGRDINQMYSVGHSVVVGGQVNLLSSFCAMYPSLSSLQEKYMASFNSYLTIAIMAEDEELFPSEEDTKKRNDVNSLFYKTVEYYHTCEQKKASQKDSSTLNQSMLSKSRLPKISLPKFSGIISDWPKYKQLFDSMVNSNTEIPVIERFHYLSTSLTGEALTLIAPFTINDENYPKAWTALCRRYDNQRLLATAYFDRILEYSSPKGPATISSIQSFITTVAETVASFKSINLNDEADFIWLSLALRKLDPDTRKQFEIHSVNTEWPTLVQLVDFVHGRLRVLQLSNPSSFEPSKVFCPSRVMSKSQVFTSYAASQPGQSICSCQATHPLYQCPVFIGRPLRKRSEFLKGKIVCYNCLKPGHLLRNCTSNSRCRTCHGKHHTLLHRASSPAPSRPQGRHPDNQMSPEENVNGESHPPVIASVTSTSPQVLLGTAVGLIYDKEGARQPIRILIDCASHVSLISVDCARRLGLSWSASNHKSLGVGETPLPKAKGKLRCQIQSRLYNYAPLHLEPHVVSVVTGHLPPSPLKPISQSNFNSDLLADPSFWKPDYTDFLLGAEQFLSIITGLPTSLDDTYEALPTIFGLVVMGKTSCRSLLQDSIFCHCITESPLSNEIITKFWETEEVTSDALDLASDPCEKHFLETHYRDSSGRYVLALPFKQQPIGFEGSLSTAMAQFKALEHKMSKYPLFKCKYQDFLKEYEDLGHMLPTTTPSAFVIPHHGVFKSNNTDAKIRVVFNASASTQNGSLNDQLYTGPKLQRDLASIILNFRRHVIAVTADLVKMYRQILIRPEDRKFQHILWRPEPDSGIVTFELNTVTYGVRSAPYQAIRTIIQLVHDEGMPFPMASKALIDDIYVDDIVSGANTLQEALKLRSELACILEKGGFQIHKWTSNSTDFVQSLDSHIHAQPLDLGPRDVCTTKILGMAWDPYKDEFYYQVNPIGPQVSKRTILSVIARLFDPIGFLSPVIFRAKSFVQELWKTQLGWDDKPNSSIIQDWLQYADQLQQLNHIRIPRFILSSSVRHLQIVGFCDASQKGFAAALYLRVITQNFEVKVSLIKAKSRLAPLKTMSVPRLELSAAHLLINVLSSVKPFMDSLNIKDTLLFTDSTIVLAWLKHSPYTLQTFVANRVSSIISQSSPQQWHHVTSEENPADVASRGISPSLLESHSLWWAGPKWLHNPSWTPSIPPNYEGDVPELKPGLSLVIQHTEPFLISWMARFSKYRRMTRVLAYIQRFIFNSRNPNNKCVGSFTINEFNSTLMTLIKATQHHEFATEFSWKDNKPLSRRLEILAAYVDTDGIIRVGGRLQNSDLPCESKFPIILTGQCRLIELFVGHLHQDHFHMGRRALQALVGRQYWVFRLRQVVKRELSKCLVCFKAQAKPQNPFMGNLPVSRVRPSRPFSKCGVDFAGPFSIKLSSRRNSPTTKAYLCIYVCMSTRAVHLEVVSSLSTDAFLAALDRFVARRGAPHSVYSDCGTNFVGAARRLKELFKWLKDSQSQGYIIRHAADKGFEWHFNPPCAPHFGGLWEAAVKSAKRHLHRVVSDRPFHFEELTTLFTRIEAILNSRPICPLTDDQNHGDVLTPGHFLIGAPLLAVPEKDVSEVSISRLSRWQLITNTIQHFWKRWHEEYLHTLQKRPKWYHSTKPFKNGDLVVMSDPSSSPLRWRIGRIAECHPGSDGIIRVVTVKDHRGTFKRPVHKLVSLSHLSEPSET